MMIVFGCFLGLFGGSLFLTPVLFLVVSLLFSLVRAVLLGVCCGCGCSSLVLRGWLVWFIFRTGYQPYVSITLGGFFIVSGFMCLCIRFLSAL